MTPFQVLSWLASKNATFSTKNGNFSVGAKDYYLEFKIPVDQQLGLTGDQLVEYLSGACTSLAKVVDDPEPKELPNGVQSTNVT